jgi:hypothetical protein
VGAAESALKREFETKITNEYRVAISAQNTGSPFAYSKPDSPLGQEIVKLAQAIDAVFAPQLAAGDDDGRGHHARRHGGPTPVGSGGSRVARGADPAGSGPPLSRTGMSSGLYTAALADHIIVDDRFEGFHARE